MITPPAMSRSLARATWAERARDLPPRGLQRTAGGDLPSACARQVADAARRLAEALAGALAARRT